jgi:plastocyanin
MKISVLGRIVALIIVVLGVSACASVQQETMVLEPGEKKLVMKVESFKFEPNDIKAHRGDVLTVKLENISSAAHNLTIKTPQGATLTSVDIPAKGTVDVRVDLAEAGIYPFYCDKPFHSVLGMKGQIEVTAP